jgi:hypothetical protein
MYLEIQLASSQDKEAHFLISAPAVLFIAEACAH